MDKLSKKIALEKLTDSTGLSADEQAAARENPDVAAELKLNKLLANEAAKAHGNQHGAPNRAATLADVSARAENERSYYRRKAIMQSVRRSWPVAATVLVAVIGVMLGIIFVQSEVAWATVDGYILEYKLEFDQHFSGTAVDPPGHPILQVERALAEWNAGHGQVGGAAVTEMEVTRYGKTFEEPKYECDIQLRLLNDSDGLLKSLREAMAATELLDEPEVFSDTWYFSEKNPDSYYAGRIVVINGKKYVYPTDFKGDELAGIRGLIFYERDWEGEAYYGFYQLGAGTRVPLADVIKVSNNSTGQITIVDVANGLDPEQFNMLSVMKGLRKSVSAAEKDLDFDPVELLKAQYDSRRHSYSGGWGPQNFRGYRLVVGLNNEPDAMVARLEAVVLEWAKNYPELLPGGEAEILLESDTVEVGETPVEWQVTFWRTDKGLAAELKDLLGQSGFEVKRMTLVVTTEEESTRDFFAPRATHGVRALPEFTASYVLLDGRDAHGVNPYYFTEELSEGDRKAALDLSNQMEQEFEDWLENINQENIDYGGFPPTFGKQNAPRTAQADGGPGVVNAVSVSTSVSEEQFDLLLGALEQLGAPEPRVINRSDYGQHPKGFSARFALVQSKQLRGIPVKDSVSIFSPSELEDHMNLFEELEAVATNWLEANQGYLGEDGKPLEITTWKLSYGDLPINLYLYSSIRQPEKFDELVQALRDAGAPEPEVSEPRPAGIPTFRSRDNDFNTDQILVYNFNIPAVTMFRTHEAEMWDMLTDEEINEHRSIIQRMENALGVWNLANPPGEGKTPVRFYTREVNGLVSAVALQSDRMDRDIMESLAAALTLEGVPDYRYGSSYQYPDRFRAKPSQPSKQVNGSSLGCNLIPSIYWNGEMQKNITTEMRQDAQDKFNQAITLVAKWRKSHPELNEFDAKLTLVEPTIEVSPLSQNGISRHFQVVIWSNDEEFCQAILAELEELLSTIHGFPEIRVGYGGMSRGG